MPTIKDNLYAPGSSYTIGVGNPNNSNAQRQGYVFGPVNESITASDAAILWWLNNGSLYPGGVGPIPLSTVTGLVEDKNNVRIIARYSNSGIAYPTASADVMTSMDASYYNFRSWHMAKVETQYDIYGRPNGPLNFADYSTTPAKIGKDRSHPPVPLLYPMVQTTILYPTVLDYNPFTLIEGRLGRINSSTVTFAGFPFPKWTVKFVNCRIRAIEVQDTAKYQILYTFVYRRSLWVDEVQPAWDLDNLVWVDGKGGAFPSGNAWYVLNTPEVSFGSGFPVYS